MSVRNIQMRRSVSPAWLAALLLVAASCQPRPKSAPADVGARPPEAATMRPSAARAAPKRSRPAPAVRSRMTASPASPASPAAPAAPAAALPLALKLAVSKTTLTLAQRARFQIRFTAVNQGSHTINPRLYSVRLLVNGRPSVAWMLAIGNGPRDRRWTALPAGESLQMGWALGKALFPAPGRYQMVLQQGTLRSAAVTVTVTP